MKKYLVATEHVETTHVHLKTDDETEAREVAKKLAARYPQRTVHIYNRMQSIQTRQELTWR